MALAMKQDELADPVNLGVFRAAAVVAKSPVGSGPVHQAWLPYFPSNVLKSIAKEQQMIARTNIKLL